LLQPDFITRDEGGKSRLEGPEEKLAQTGIAQASDFLIVVIVGGIGNQRNGGEEKPEKDHLFRIGKIGVSFGNGFEDGISLVVFSQVKHMKKAFMMLAVL
jgi:hypothetical protein